jgi:hypothetical protein
MLGGEEQHPGVRRHVERMTFQTEELLVHQKRLRMK